MKQANKRPQYGKFLLLYSLALITVLASGCIGDTQDTQYNLTLVANQSGVLGFMRLVNSELMFGWFGTLILTAIFFILNIAFIQKTQDVARSAVASTFICAGLSLFLVTLGLIPELVMFIMVILSVLSLAMLFLIAKE